MSKAVEVIKQAEEALIGIKNSLVENGLAPQITAGMVVPLHKALKPVPFFIKGCGNGSGGKQEEWQKTFGFFKDKLNRALNPIGLYVLGSASDGAAARVKAQTERCSSVPGSWTPSMYAVREGVWAVLDRIVMKVCNYDEVKKEEWRKLKGDSAGLQSSWGDYVSGSWCKINSAFINSVSFSEEEATENPVACRLMCRLKYLMPKRGILNKDVLRRWLRDTSRGLQFLGRRIAPPDGLKGLRDPGNKSCDQILVDVHAQDPKHNGAKLTRVTTRLVKMGDSVVSRDHLRKLPTRDLKISYQFINNSDPQNKDLLCNVISSKSMAAMGKALSKEGTLTNTGEATVTIYQVVRWYNLGIYHGTAMERIAYFAQALGTLYVTLIARPRPNALLPVTPISIQVCISCALREVEDTHSQGELYFGRIFQNHHVQHLWNDFPHCCTWWR